MTAQQKTDAARALAASKAQQARVKLENAAHDAKDMRSLLANLHDRLMLAIKIHATAEEAYDSYFQQRVRDAIKPATGENDA